MIDGVHFAESCWIAARGIGIDGVKHRLAVVGRLDRQRDLGYYRLLVGLRERDLDVTSRCSSGSTVQKPRAKPWSTCSTTRWSNAANCTRFG